MLSFLMIVEAFALLSLGSFKLLQIQNGKLIMDTAVLDSPVVILSMSLSILAIMAAIGFFRLWRFAWISAMLVQGIVISFLLTVHFTGQTTYIVDYGVMAFAIFIVIYLNYNEVHAIFRSTVIPISPSRNKIH